LEASIWKIRKVESALSVGGRFSVLTGVASIGERDGGAGDRLTVRACNKAGDDAISRLPLRCHSANQS
jgi:hypothetical protein